MPCKTAHHHTQSGLIFLKVTHTHQVGGTLDRAQYDKCFCWLTDDRLSFGKSITVVFTGLQIEHTNLLHLLRGRNSIPQVVLLCCEISAFALIILKHYIYYILRITPEWHAALNPKVDSPPFAAAVAAPLQHYQVDPVHQPWGLSHDTDRNISKFQHCGCDNYCITGQKPTVNVFWGEQYMGLSN